MTGAPGHHTLFIDRGTGTPEDWAVVFAGLDAHNRSAGGMEAQPLAVLARDEDGRALGGLVGFTQGGWLYIELMWLPAALRGQGLGSALLADAEAEALERGCGHAHLDLYSFQAEGFFSGRGYQPFGTLEAYPPGHRRRFLCKRLAA